MTEDLSTQFLVWENSDDSAGYFNKRLVSQNPKHEIIYTSISLHENVYCMVVIQQQRYSMRNQWENLIVQQNSKIERKWEVISYFLHFLKNTWYWCLFIYFALSPVFSGENYESESICYGCWIITDYQLLYTYFMTLQY